MSFKSILDVGGSHPHLLLEVHFGERVIVLSVLDLFVPLINEVVASSDVVVPIVFNALLSVLRLELVLL